MNRFYSNPNNRFRRLHTERVASMSQLQGLPTSGDVAADAANRQHAQLQAGEELRQSRKHMLEVAGAAKAIVDSKDKRRRPKHVKKQPFRVARNLRLTRTKRTKVKRK